MSDFEPIIGSLYVISTPIGNLEDITVRALKILNKIDILLVENIKITNILLNKYNIKNVVLISCNKNNEHLRCQEILNYINLNKTIALISSAGTPTISDPGKIIVNTVKKNGYNVIPIPGPVAFTTALTCIGLEKDNFYFHGFLPKKIQERKNILKYFKYLNINIIFYESKYRLKKTILNILEILPKNYIFIAKELTKKFETIIEGTASTILNIIEKNDFIIKGEFVVCIKNFYYLNNDKNQKILEEIIQCMLNNKISIKDISKNVASITNFKKSEIYNSTLNIKKNILRIS